MNRASLQCFAPLLRSRPGTAPAGNCLTDDDLQALVSVNRMEPLFFLMGIRPELWRNAYARNVCRAEPALTVGLDVLDRLERSAIPCLPLRGPFWGVQYWGDPAARTFADLDFLVVPGQARRALKLLEQAGFRLRPRGMPECFFRAVHLHYPLVHSGTGTYCDLHWAVDHPFRVDRVPYDRIIAESTFKEFGPHRWRVAAPLHEKLITALHFVKEHPRMPAESDSTLWARSALSGQIKPLLDLEVCGFLGVSISEFQAVERLAREWHIDEAVSRARTAQQGLQDAVLPSDGERVRVGATNDSFFSSLSFRHRRLGDAWSYLWQGGYCRAGAHLIGAGFIAAVCLAVWKFRALRLRGVS